MDLFLNPQVLLPNTNIDYAMCMHNLLKEQYIQCIYVSTVHMHALTYTAFEVNQMLRVQKSYSTSYQRQVDQTTQEIQSIQE